MLVGHGRRIALTACICALLVAALALAPAASAERSSLDDSMKERLSRAVVREIDRVFLPGAIVGVQRADRAPWMIARGVANLETREPMGVRDHIRIGSVTKSFVTTLVVELDEEGLLSLDDPISKYVAGVPAGDRITLRQLADMTSGLRNYFTNERFAPAYLSGETFTPDELVQLGIELPPLFAPGAAWSYSNTNTVLLGRVIEQVTGEPLAEALRERVLQPLGLRSTSLPSQPAMPKPFAEGYTNQTVNGQLGDATFNTPTATWAAGGMVSTVRDLLRAAPMFGTGAPLLDPESHRERVDWVTLPPNSPRQSYGIGLMGFNGWIGHNGALPGYTTTAWNLPGKELSLVVSVNSDIHRGKVPPGHTSEPASALAHRLTKVLTPAHVAPGALKLDGLPVTSSD